MNLLDRIAAALADVQRTINHELFEECATYFLQDQYPGIVPIRGGSDSGRDADVLAQQGTPPVRMAVTSSRSYKRARENLKSAMESLIEHDMLGRTVISVSLAELNQSKRKLLEDFAVGMGFKLEAIIDRAYFVDRLRKSGEWREKLLGLSGGPFSLSKLSSRANPSDSEYKLVGRENELARMRTFAADTIVYGPPGVGKSAMLEHVEGLYFVDGNPLIANLMDDILETDPALLVVDDATRRLEVLENLQIIRRREGLPFRIIAVCWPHERDTLAAQLLDADEIELLPLIRSDIAEIATARGVTRDSVIAKVLDQAQGRPAWAVRLIELLKSETEWRTVHTGEALRGQVWTYIARSGLSKEARDVLSIVALIGSLAESEISAVANQLGMPRPAVAHIIEDLAVGGLFDVRQQTSKHGNQEDIYRVAPEILATSIVIDAFFGSGVAVLPVPEIFNLWPSKRVVIALNCIRATILGSGAARPVATALFNAIADQEGVQVGSDILNHYLYLGPEEADAAISRSVARWEQSQDEPQHQRKTLLNVVSNYLASAIRDMHLLNVTGTALDFASSIGDETLRNEFLDQLVDKIRNAWIPEGMLNLAILLDLWKTAESWFERTGKRRSDVITAFVVALLKPAFDSSSLDPADQRVLRLISAVLAPDDMRTVGNSVWAKYEALEMQLSRQELGLLAKLFSAWAQLARGFTLNNLQLSESQMNEARSFALRLADFVIERAETFPASAIPLDGMHMNSGVSIRNGIHS